MVKRERSDLKWEMFFIRDVSEKEKKTGVYNRKNEIEKRN